MNAIRFIWKAIIWPIVVFILTIGGLAGAINDIPVVWERFKESRMLDWFSAPLAILPAFFIENWLVMTPCGVFVILMYYILILEPSIHARRREEKFLNPGDDDE